MKNSAFHLFTVLGLFISLGASHAQQAAPQVSDGATANTWVVTWRSVVGRSYFLEVSDDLQTWTYAPDVFYGDGSIQGLNVSSPSSPNQMFFRLKFTDLPVPNGDAGAADFDGDGISNFDEVTLTGTEPFLDDTDGDALSDGEEVSWGVSDPMIGDTDGNGTDDSLEDFDGDGVINFLELALVSPVLNPTTAPFLPRQAQAGPVGNEYETLTFRCLSGTDHGYNYQVQESADLFNWSDIDHYEYGEGPVIPFGLVGTTDTMARTVAANDGTGAQQFTVRSSQSDTQYMRLIVREKFPGFSLRNEHVTLANIRDHNNAHIDHLIASGTVFSRKIFDYYDPNADIRWAKWNWTNKLDFSGVAWDNPQHGNVAISSSEITMISPEFGVTGHNLHHRGLTNRSHANAHIAHTANSPVTFHDRDGNKVTRVITSYAHAYGTNLTVVRLNQPLPPKVATYGLLPAKKPDGTPVDWEQYLVGANVLIGGKDRTCLIYEIDTFTAFLWDWSIKLKVNPSIPTICRRQGDKFVGGDSSGPCFILINGKLFLIGTLVKTGAPGEALDFLDDKIFTELENLVFLLGGSKYLRTLNFD
ncbi:MAG: hypothetical protein ABF332_02695, partial [Akkermansiaceae bacterium]